MLPINPNRPIKYKNKEKVCTPEELIFFFKNCFAPKERKQKMILLTQLGCICRISEACAINIRDFHKDSNFRKLDMLIQKKIKTITLKNGSQKIVGDNEIVIKDIPESIAAYLRVWISDNIESIIYHNGYIFPPNPIHNTSYYSPQAMIHFMSNKRKQLIKLFPDRNFDKIIGFRIYRKDKQLKGHTIKKEGNLYLWSTHLMKRFAGTYSYLLTKDPIFTKELLNHKKLSTTEQHYIDPARVLEKNKKVEIINKLFDINFYKAISKENEDIPAVWEEFNTQKQ